MEINYLYEQSETKTTTKAADHTKLVLLNKSCLTQPLLLSTALPHIVKFLLKVHESGSRLKSKFNGYFLVRRYIQSVVLCEIPNRQTNKQVKVLQTNATYNIPSIHTHLHFNGHFSRWTWVSQLVLSCLAQ